MKNGDLLSCAIDGTMKIIRLGKNEGYKVIQIIDTTKEKVENSNPIFSNKLLVLLQIKSNENIITANGGILLFYKHPKDCKDTYEFNYIVSYNNKQENYYDMLFNNNSLSSLMEINNDNFIGLNNNTAIFFE
jgi:predicted signal transduction protein with EAL and GGDEF domain